MWSGLCVAFPDGETKDVMQSAAAVLTTQVPSLTADLRPRGTPLSGAGLRRQWQNLALMALGSEHRGPSGASILQLLLALSLGAGY